MKIIVSILIVIVTLQANSSKDVFEKYCWGCHHETAEAFGPSFTQIASTRNIDEIRAMITDPIGVSKVLGYKRNAMPQIKLTKEELKSISNYIISFKPLHSSNKGK